MDHDAIAEALEAATGQRHHAEDITGSRVEPDGDTIATTRFGVKARITTDGEVQLLVGPGSAPDVYDPPEPQAGDDLDDLPPLEAEGEGGDQVDPDPDPDPDLVAVEYDEFKVDELKAMLESRELPTDGKKAELIERLEEDDERLAAEDADPEPE